MSETGYGFFCGGDPREFSPDVECCSPAEIEAHKLACEAWDTAEHEGRVMPAEPGSCRHIVDADGKVIGWACGGKFGIGVYTYETSDMEEDDAAHDAERIPRRCTD